MVKDLLQGRRSWLLHLGNGADLTNILFGSTFRGSPSSPGKLSQGEELNVVTHERMLHLNYSSNIWLSL